MNLKKNTLPLILVIVTLLLAVISVFLLPQTVVIQLGLDGQPTNTMSKLTAIVTPLPICALGLMRYYLGQGAQKERDKGLVIAVVAPLVMLLTLIMNH